MTSVDSVTLDVPDIGKAERFYEAAFGLDDRLRLRAGDTVSSGFRGFTLSLIVSQPGNVDSLFGTAVDAGAEVLKPAAKGFWGYGGVVRAPDGAIWKLATSSKKDAGPVTREIDAVVLLLGVADVKASKQFYVEHGMTVGKSFGGKYAEFVSPSGRISLSLLGRRSLAKDAGTPADGTGSHRIVIGGDAGAFTDPDGFVWESAT